jgi:hypothetical protein
MSTTIIKMNPFNKKSSSGKKIKPTPVHRGSKYSWEQVCKMRELWNNGQGMSVREIMRLFPPIGEFYLRQILYGEVRITEDPDHNRPCFVNEVSDMPPQYLRSPNGELFRRRNSGRCLIRPAIPATTIAAIKHGRRMGKSVSELSVLYGVGRRYIHRILEGKHRKDVP